MSKTISSRILWLAKGAALFWGSALTLALMLGVATAALAAVPGDPFKLGKTNAVNAISKLAGSVAGPSLQINNDSTNASATALELRVRPGKAPMKVNSGVKVAKLNADKVDGKDASAFLGAGAKATDANLLDGKDSTTFANGTAGKANNADLLDGKDSTDFASFSIFATVLGNGNLSTFDSSHAVSSRRISTGIYEVTFDRAVDNGCIHLAQSLDREAFTTTTEGSRYLPFGTPLLERKVRVDQFDHAGNLVDGAVVVGVVCK